MGGKIKMPWTYKQISGELCNPTNTIKIQAYSGNGEDKNNHLAEKVPEHGPIPCGNWKITQFLSSDGKCGPDVLVLTPATTEFAKLIESWGRGPYSFRIHGDSISAPGTASDGCIIIDHTDRLSIWNSEDHDLIVVPS